MSFYSRYRLEQLLADGPAKTFRAAENSGGRARFLHLFSPEGRFLFDALTARFRDAAGNPRPPLIETGEYSGSLYAVTDVLEPFVNLRAWLEASSPAAAPAAVPDLRPVAGSSTKEPGEFTRMFAVPQQPGAPPVETKREPGAFTLEFMVQAPPPSPPVAAQPAWPAAPPLVPVPPAAPPPSQAVWPDRKPTGDGDLSDLFDSLPPGESVDVEEEQVRAAQSVPPAKKPFKRAGTFTRVFGPGGPRKETTQERVKMDSLLFDSDIRLKSAAPSPGSGSEAKKGGGPGEYTRMMAVPQFDEPVPPPALPAAPLIQPQAPPSNRAPSNRAMIIAFSLVTILAIAVIALAVLLYLKT